MSVLYVAVPVAICMGGFAMVACIRCIRGGQYDDLEGASVRLLIDDDAVRQDSHTRTSVGDVREPLDQEANKHEG